MRSEAVHLRFKIIKSKVNGSKGGYGHGRSVCHFRDCLVDFLWRLFVYFLRGAAKYIDFNLDQLLSA
jgi:hypothetical protein